MQHTMQHIAEGVFEDSLYYFIWEGGFSVSLLTVHKESTSSKIHPLKNSSLPFLSSRTLDIVIVFLRLFLSKQANNMFYGYGCLLQVG